MLSNIERNKKTPTIGVALAIAQALEKELSDLINSHEAQSLVGEDSPHISLLDQLYKFPVLKGRAIVGSAFLSKRGGVDVYSPHSKGMTKFIIMKRGSLEVIIDGEQFFLCQGESLCYHADVPHTHRYPEDKPCEFFSYLLKPIQNIIE